MNKQYTLKSYASGYYYVSGQGFVAQNRCAATKLDALALDKVSGCGFFGKAEEVIVNRSFAVNYVRPGEVVNGVVQANRNNPSKRRFKTFDEAWQHGTKARTRDESATHTGFHVTESTDAVNAEINWKTGLTNSL